MEGVHGVIVCMRGIFDPDTTHFTTHTFHEFMNSLVWKKGSQGAAHRMFVF